jgi:AcrR family transcriptional regulator
MLGHDGLPARRWPSKALRSFSENVIFIWARFVYDGGRMVVNANRARRTARGVERALAPRALRLAELHAQRTQEHEALLRAARRVFVRKGYAQTRVEDILAEAGISTRAFYRFHASKGELFLELFDRANTAAMQRLREHVARHDDAPSRLDAYVAATLDLAYEPRLKRETSLFSEVPAELTAQHAPDVAACRQQLVSVLHEIIAEGRASGSFPDADPDVDAWSLHGALGATLTRVLQAEPPPRRAPLERRLRRFCRAALGAR